MAGKIKQSRSTRFATVPTAMLLVLCVSACWSVPVGETDAEKHRKQQAKEAEATQRERMKEIRRNPTIELVAAKVAQFYFDSVKAGDVDEADYVLHHQVGSRYNERMTWLTDWEDFTLESGYGVDEDETVTGKPVGEIFFTVRVRQGSWERRRGRLLVSPNYRMPKEVQPDQPIDMSGLWLEIFSIGYDKKSAEYQD